LKKITLSTVDEDLLYSAFPESYIIDLVLLPPLKDARRGMLNFTSTSHGLPWTPVCNRIRVWIVK
jgi:hypothetical protein